MEEWFIIQRFYHGLICSTREHIDVAAGGSLFALSIEEACKLIEKMASNQSWDEECTQTHTCKVHHLEEVDMLTAKIDLLMKKLENSGLDHFKMVFVLIKASMLGGTNPVSRSTTANKVVWDRISIEMSHLSEISSRIR
jgi:hypothetical protein